VGESYTNWDKISLAGALNRATKIPWTIHYKPKVTEAIPRLVLLQDFSMQHPGNSPQRKNNSNKTLNSTSKLQIKSVH